MIYQQNQNDVPKSPQDHHKLKDQNHLSCVYRAQYKKGEGDAWIMTYLVDILTDSKFFMAIWVPI